MKRLRRIILNGLAVLSLLLCVATLCAWPMTRHRLAWVLWDRDSECWLTSGGGVLRFAVAVGDRPIPGEEGLTLFLEPRSLDRDHRYFQPMTFYGEFNELQRAGFGLQVGRTVTRPRGGYKLGHKPYLIVYVPNWFAAVGLAVLPGYWAVRMLRRRHRRRMGHCVACCYDLTGNVSGVCPECGAKIAEAK